LSTNAIADTSKVYSNDSEGLKTYGEKSKLVDSVMNGKRISLLIHIPSSGSKQVFFPDRVFVNDDVSYIKDPDGNFRFYSDENQTSILAPGGNKIYVNNTNAYKIIGGVETVI